jgi:hypothetical protein
MSDSTTLFAKLGAMSDAEYAQGRYPFKVAGDTDESWTEFRPIFPTPVSPLTGAGFKITPVGMLIPGSEERYQYGRIDGYLVEVNGPACAIGHNRQLVNGVPAAAEVAHSLLVYWLAANGCTKEGLDRVRLENAELESATLTFLFPFATKKLAREALLEFRRHCEGLINEKISAWGPKKPAAYAYPPGDPDASLSYTFYVGMREFKIIAYVKEGGAGKAFLLPLDDAALEAQVADESARTLRIEVQVHGKWLKDNKLIKVAQWRGNKDAYADVFKLLRDTLRLDEIQLAMDENGGLRIKGLKKTTVPKLNLPEKDKKYLLWHLNDRIVRDHPDFRAMGFGTALNSRISASKIRIYEKTGVDITIPWRVQSRQLSPRLATLLVYEGEFQTGPFDSDDKLYGYLFSRVSVPVVIRKLKAITDKVIKHGPDSVPPVPQNTVYNAPGQPKKRGSGIGTTRVPKEPMDDDTWID